MKKNKLRGYVTYFLERIRSILFVAIDFLFPESDIEYRVRTISYADIQKYLSLHTDDSECTTFFPYRRALIKQMMWLLKYRANKNVAEIFGTILSEYVMETLAESALFENFTDPLLIPMPLSPLRKKERGFNQVTLIAEVIAKDNRSVFLTEKALRKVRETKLQTTLSRKERLINLRNAFTADPRVVKGQNVILLDDVVTTGSTMLEAHRALRQAGARRVMLLAVAR